MEEVGIRAGPAGRNPGLLEENEAPASKGVRDMGKKQIPQAQKARFRDDRGAMVRRARVRVRVRVRVRELDLESWSWRVGMEKATSRR
jgi:SRSO17 transposase